MQVRTTIDIPDSLLRRVKSAAAEHGVSLSAFVTEALADKLRTPGTAEKPWMRSFGKLRSLHKETVRINRIIDEEFGRLQPWLQPHPAVR
jgi:hypothetical protein